MPKVTLLTLQEVKDALEQYQKTVEESPLSLSAKNTYLLHARQFVRWLDDDFTQGATVGRR